MNGPRPPEWQPYFDQVAAASERALGDPVAVCQELQDLLPVVEALDAPSLVAATLLALARCSFYQFQTGQVLEYAEQALRALGTADDPELRGRIHNTLGVAKQELHLYRAAIEDYLTALRLAEEQDDQALRARVMTNFAICSNFVGNYAEALAWQRDVLALARTHAFEHEINSGLTNLIEIYLAVNQPERVPELAKELIGRLTQQGIPGWEADIRRKYATALRRLGQLHGAGEQVRRAAEINAPLQAPEVDAEIALEYARVLLQNTEHYYAQASLERALGLAEGLEPPDLELQSQIYAAQADLAEQRQDFATARQHLAQAEALRRAHHERRQDDRTRGLVAGAQARALQREAQLERERAAELRARDAALLDAQRQLEYLRLHDTLTGTLNREAFLAQVQAVLDESPSCAIGLIFLDLDRFKVVNELHGAGAGNEVLRQVAERLRAHLGPDAWLGRVGGDEFNVLLRVPSAEELLSRAEALRAALREPLEVAGRRLTVTASLGCAFAAAPTPPLTEAAAEGDPRDAVTLQGQASMAMYYVRQDHRSRVLLYSPQIQARHQRRLKLERDLKLATSRGEMQVYYQGRYAVEGTVLVGFEALLRWNHPEYGPISPATFIPLTESSGQILELGHWVLQTSCRNAVNWQFPQRGLTMAVNISALQLTQEDYAACVREALDETGLPAEALLLELTESLILHDTNLARSHMLELQELGVRFAVDDFGIGYSSLSVLRNLPFNHMKIDRTLMPESDLLPPTSATPALSASHVMVSGIVKLGHDLNMVVTAEGLESQHQLNYLRQIRCDFVQGYLLDRPQPEAEIEKRLSASAALLPEDPS